MPLHNQEELIQKQPFGGVRGKRCSENMQQIYRRTPMPKLLCNFIEIALRHGCSPINLQHFFRTPFPKNTSGWLLCNFIEIVPRHECSPVNLLHIFRTPFSKNTSGWLLLLIPQVGKITHPFCKVWL